LHALVLGVSKLELQNTTPSPNAKVCIKENVTNLLWSLKKAFNFVTSSQDSQDLQHQNIYE
jgi:hypothetical protein